MRDHVAVRWLFLRVLGLVFLAAFGAIWVQVDGLFGAHGIVPVSERIRNAHESLGPAGWQQVLTVFWWDASDAALHRALAGGSLLSLLLILGVAPIPVLASLLVLYHSLFVVGSPFLNFQWDTLLLETGFLAIFYAPWALVPRPSREAGPARASVFLMRYMLFRLMFASGAVKLTSGDVNWANLTAMDFHYMTQPLPPWTAWYWHHLPPFAHKLESLATFIVELAVPFLAFGHRQARGAAFGAYALLLAMLLVTGNYGFFNYLTFALAVTILDDTMLPARLRGWIAGPGQPGRRGEWPGFLVWPIAALCFVISTMHFAGGIELGPARWPRLLVQLDDVVAPAHVFHEYGLFRTMTVDRPEVVIEGSNDGVAWKAYELPYKMGDPSRAPRFVAPHMPRLDWQLWFAALARVGRQDWFVSLLQCILQGSKPVLALFAVNPFPDAPPKYVRAQLYDYRFSTAEERRATGAWWVRTLTGPFFPAASLRE